MAACFLMHDLSAPALPFPYYNMILPPAATGSGGIDCTKSSVVVKSK